MPGPLVQIDRRHLLALAVIMLGPARGLAQSDDPLQQYRSGYDWTISYPADWRIDDSDPTFVQLMPRSGPLALIGLQTGEVRFDSLDALVGFLNAFTQDLHAQQGQSYRILDRQLIRRPDGTTYAQIDEEIAGPNGGRARVAVFLVGHLAVLIDGECHAADWSTLEPTLDLMIRSFVPPPG